jgi:hypothetical protein
MYKRIFQIYRPCEDHKVEVKWWVRSVIFIGWNGFRNFHSVKIFYTHFCIVSTEHETQKFLSKKNKGIFNFWMKLSWTNSSSHELMIHSLFLSHNQFDCHSHQHKKVEIKSQQINVNRNHFKNIYIWISSKLLSELHYQFIYISRTHIFVCVRE